MRLRSATAIALLAASPLGVAGEPAGDWLARMDAAVRGTQYRGTFVYQHGGRLETVQIVHRQDGDSERERLVTLSGTPLEIVRDGDIVKCVLPDNRSVKVERDPERRALRTRLPTDASALRPHYTVALVGTDKVAGRDCQRLDVMPRDAARYGMQLCLDSRTALPLSSVLVDTDGQGVVEQVQFTAIEFPARISDAEFALTTPVEGYAWHVKDAEPAARDLEPAGSWEVATLPPGFRMQSEALKRAVKTGAPVHHLVYSDGLATVSVFVERVDSSRPGLTGAARRGAISVFGHLVGEHQVTVLGEVPPATVEAIARAVAPRAVRAQP